MAGETDLQAELEQNNKMLKQANGELSKAASEVQRAAGFREPGKMIDGLGGSVYYVPPQPLEICPRREIKQVLSAEFISSLRLTWHFEGAEFISGPSEAGSEPATPSANLDAGASDAAPDGDVSPPTGDAAPLQ